MKKIKTEIELSSFLYRNEKKKIVFLSITHCLILLFLIIVSSFSINLPNYIFYKDYDNYYKIMYTDEKYDNSIVISDEVLNLAKEKYPNATVVKEVELSFFDEPYLIKENSMSSSYFNSATYRYVEYDYYNQYEEYNDILDELHTLDLENKPGIVRSESNKAIITKANEDNITSEIYLVSGEKIVGDKYTFYFSDMINNTLYNYLIENTSNIEYNNTSYTFSFDNVKDAINFYDEAKKIDPSIESSLNFNGKYIYITFNISKKISLVFLIISLVVFITIMVSFLNMIVILFIDKQKNIGLLKAQGLTNSKLQFILMLKIVFMLIISSLCAMILSLIFMPLLNQFINNIFLNQFLNNPIVGINILMLILWPLISLFIIIFPAVLYTKYKTKKEIISLINS